MIGQIKNGTENVKTRFEQISELTDGGLELLTRKQISKFEPGQFRLDLGIFLATDRVL